MRQLFMLLTLGCVLGMIGCGGSSSPTTVDPEAAEEIYGADFKAKEEAAAKAAAAAAAKAGPGN